MKRTVQDNLVELIKAAIPDHLRLADEIADTLNISADSAYRRIRGETAFDIDEIAAVCQQFNISFDSLIASQAGGIVTFSYNVLYDIDDGFEQYLENIRSYLNIVERNNGLITYAAEDVPIFRTLSKPMMAEFKMFSWLKAVVNHPSLQNLVYKPGILPERNCKLAEDVVRAYNRVNSVEIWTEETIHSTLKQLEYFWESGQIEKKEYAIEICGQIRSMVNDMANEAENEHKLTGSNASFKLYNCEVLIGNNCIVVEAGSLKRTFISYNAINSINTGDQKFGDEADQWLQNLIRKSTMISGMAEKHRYKFFKVLETSIQRTISKISGINGSSAN